MNDETYALLRHAAHDIRQQALDMGRTSLAIEGMQKAVGFLVEEVQLKGDVPLGTLNAYAAALRSLADAIDRRDTHHIRAEVQEEAKHGN
jgi:hypothetical protein